MFTKKSFQLILLLAVVFSAFAAAPAAHTASACGNSVTVFSGDTVRKIADRCGVTVAGIRQANPSIGSGDLIYPGQVLILPGALYYGSNGSYNTYYVAYGDTLKTIAARFGTTVDVLLSLNPSITNANVIYEGQKLTVPASGSVPVPGGSTYTVQRGDTLRKIADRFGTTVDALLKVNPQITDPNKIYVGQVITLPAGTTTYVVQRGDTLRIIAARYGTTVDNLLALNPQIKDPNVIYVGQVIRIW